MTSSSSSSSSFFNTLSPANEPLRVACIGGGQLGRMMALEAPRLNIEMYFLDPSGLSCPAAQVVPSSNIIKGSLKDPAAIQQLITTSQATVVTVEIEHVNADALIQIEEQRQRKQQEEPEDGDDDVETETKTQTSNISVQPSGYVLKTIQDKLLQKEFFARHSTIPLPKFQSIPTIASIHEAAKDDKLGLPFMLKARRGGYDGKGNAVLKSTSKEDIQQALVTLGYSIEQQQEKQQRTTNDTASNEQEQPWLDLYAEAWVDFECEVAVMVVQSSKHSNSNDNNDNNNTSIIVTDSYPAVDAIQQNSICRVVLAPSRSIDGTVRRQCEEIAKQAIDVLGKYCNNNNNNNNNNDDGSSSSSGASGMFGVELFVTKPDNSKNGERSILLNEIAPRPHNTGHYTQNACSINQFENHLRAICGLPLGSTTMNVPVAAMLNILGAPSGKSDDTLKSSNLAMSMMMNNNTSSSSSSSSSSSAVVHWYGKTSCRAGRKMGHINLTATTEEELDSWLMPLIKAEGISTDLVSPPMILPSSTQQDKEEEE